MCVSINNTKKAPTTKACSLFFILQTLDNIFVREAFLFHYEIIYIFHEQIFIETIIYNKWKSLLKINRRNSLLLPPFNREKKGSNHVLKQMFGFFEHWQVRQISLNWVQFQFQLNKKT